MVKADCFNPSHGSYRTRLAGVNGVDACIRCCTVILRGRAELPAEPARKEREKTYGGPKYTARLRCNQGITYVP